MTISEIVAAELLECEGVIDNTPAYNPYIRMFTHGQELRDYDDGEAIYKRSGEYLFIEDYDDSNTYGLYDIAFKDGINQYVEALQGTRYKQPSEYNNIDTSFVESDWQYRYLRLYDEYYYHTDIDGVFHGMQPDGHEMESFVGYWSGASDQYGHIATDDEDSWKNCYIIGNSYRVHDILYTLNTKSGHNPLEAGDEAWLPRHSITFIDDNGDETTLTSDTGFMLTVGDVIGHDDTNDVDMFDFTIDYCDTSRTHDYRVIDEYEPDGNDPKPIYIDDIYIPQAYIYPNYVRTSVDVAVEYITIDELQWKVLEKISEIPWGWTYYRPSNEYAPFDDKKYTYLEVDNDVIYTIKAKDKFDMVAFNGLMSSRMKVEIYNENDELVETKEMIPKCYSTLAGKTKVVQGVAFIYLDNEYLKDTKLKVYIYTLEGKVRIGGGYLGNRNVAGFTNLEFKNSFINFNYYKKDEWGNVVSTNDDNAKIRVFEGTADIELKEYDDLTPILQHFMDAKAIIDGSDNWNNETPDGQNFFVGSSIIGRVRSFTQSTKTINDRMDYTATYSFKVEEDV